MQISSYSFSNPFHTYPSLPHFRSLGRRLFRSDRMHPVQPFLFQASA